MPSWTILPKGFAVKDGIMPADIPPEWFVDTGRGLVVFKLFIEDGRPEEWPDTLAETGETK